MIGLAVRIGVLALVVAVAAPMRRVLGVDRPSLVPPPAPPRGWSRRAGDPVSVRHGVVAVVGAGGWIVGGPVVAAVACVSVVAVRRLGVARAAARRRVQVAGAVPDLVDLFLVAASAGQPVATALLVVAPRAPAPVAPVVAAAAERFRRGLPLAECLRELGRDLAPEGAPVADALAQAAGSGVPLVPLLEAVAATARDQRRRRAQEAARRLPVTMLLPLVACTLPAAVLLAVVPVLVVSIGSLTR